MAAGPLAVWQATHEALVRAVSSTGLWKVLVFDARAQKIVAPVLKVGELKQHGVTLVLNVQADRGAIPDTIAVYLLAPTEANVDAVLADVAAQKYAKYDVQFISHVPDHLMKTFTHKATAVLSQLNLRPQQVFARITDRYVDFVPLDNNKFTLELPDAFRVIYDPKGNDTNIMSIMDKIVSGLVSVIKTLNVRPLIKIPKNESSPARMLGLSLARRLSDLQAQFGVNFLAADTPRPILILTDRSFDFYAPLCHSWTYEALLHDCFGLNLNWVVVKGAKRELNFTTDEFWARHQGSIYPEVAEDAAQMLNQFKSEVDSLNAESGNLEGFASNLNSAIENAPNIMNKKQSLDLHTLVAQELYNVLVQRSLPDFYNAESDMLDNASHGLTVNPKALRELMDKGTEEDRQRLVLCTHILCKDLLPAEEINHLNNLVKKSVDDAAATPALKYLRYYDNMVKMSSSNTYESLRATSLGAEAAPTFAAKSMNVAKGIFWQGFKQILQMKQQPKVVSLVEGLLDASRKSSIIERYEQLDPLGGDSSMTTTAPPQVILFVVGGGSYVEADACAKWAATKDPRGTPALVYGSTAFLRPTQFLADMNLLGHGVV